MTTSLYYGMAGIGLLTAAANLTQVGQRGRRAWAMVFALVALSAVCAAFGQEAPPAVWGPLAAAAAMGLLLHAYWSLRDGRTGTGPK